MGRTLRKRQRRENARNTTFNNDLSVINLKKWLSINNWNDETRINISDFPNSGRGVFFKTKMNNGDKLISIPYQALITLNTLENDLMFRELFENLNITLSVQQIFSLFLVFQKHLGSKSVWYNYINTIPKKFSVPYFCGKVEKTILLKHISKLVQSQNNQINQILQLVLQKFQIKICKHCDKKITEIFNEAEILWSFFAINTRCVYINPEIVKMLLIETQFFLNLISDNPSIALVPLLDMFNHDCHAQTEAKLNLDIYSIKSLLNQDNKIYNIFDKCNSSSQRNLNKSINLFYELYTLKPYKAYSECFISYGKHDNLKLLVEYGFFVQDNPHDFILINLADITLLSEMYKVSNFYKKQMFMKSHNLEEQLFLSNEGFSPNLIMVMHLFFNKTIFNFKEIYKIININEIQVPCTALINNKLNEINTFFAKASNLEACSESLKMVIGFYQQQTKMLKKILLNII